MKRYSSVFAKKRRLVLLLALAGLVLLGGYSWKRGLRYPPLQWDPHPRANVEASAQGWRVESEGAYSRGIVGDVVTFRAFVPEPTLRFKGTGSGGAAEVVVENVHPEATLVGDATLGEGGFSERRDGLNRRVSLEVPRGAVLELRFDFPGRERYRVAAIGDTGGRDALRWCLRRAGELGADFVLHLGDIAYLDDDYENAVEGIHGSPVPVFVAIGNHDFHGGTRNRFLFFVEHFGPRNAHFELGGVLFLNLDTAGDTLPYNGGERGRLLEQAFDLQASRVGRANEAPTPVIAFTHRPLDDPRLLGSDEGEPHALNRRGEAEFLRDALLRLGTVALLAGHIHEAHDFEYEGLRQIISGCGLGLRAGHQQILIADFSPQLEPEFRWEPLEFPEDLLQRTREDYPGR